MTSTQNIDRLITEYVNRWYLPEEDNQSELETQDAKGEMARQLKAIIEFKEQPNA